MNDKFICPENVTMTYTGLLPGKKGKVIHVSFERKNDKGTDYVEMVLPSRKVLSAKGFEEGEIAQLKIFLKGQEKDIIRNAKKINHDIIYRL